MKKGEGFPIRKDMTRARAEGYKAFMDGENEMKCPYRRNDPNSSEWHAGYQQAKGNKEKRDEESYR